MERGIMVSEKNLDIVAEVLQNHCDELLPANGIPSKKRIKKVLTKVISEVKRIRTRKRIEPPEGSCTVSEASQRYKVSHGTLSGWIKKGYLSPVLTTSRRTFINEGEVAYLSQIYETSKGRGNKRMEQFFRQLAED